MKKGSSGHDEGAALRKTGGAGMKAKNRNKAMLWRRRGKRIFGGAFKLILITGICFIILFPMFLMVSSSVKTVDDMYDDSVVWVTKTTSLSKIQENIADSVRLLDYLPSIGRTGVYILIMTSLQVLSSCMIGYGLARFNFRFKNLVFSFVILTIIIPPFTTILPTYLNFGNFNLFGLFDVLGIKFSFLETHWPSALLSATGFGLKSGLFIFIMKQFFEGVPKELEEAAGLDGCSAFGTFARIMVPTSGGAILTVSLFSIVWQYSDTLYTTIFMSRNDLLIKQLYSIHAKFNFLINMGSVFFPTNRTAADGTILIQMSALLTILPVLVMYIVLQKYFVESISRTGIVE